MEEESSKQNLQKEKLAQLKEDYDNEWWKPSAIDKGSLKAKMLRVGCRPLKRKYLLCMKSEMDVHNYAKCNVWFKMSKIYDRI